MKINEAVRRMHPPRYTARQAADLVGRDVDTLKRWRRQGVYVPSDSRAFGSTTVGLYTDEDIAAMRDLAKQRKPGRKQSVTNTLKGREAKNGQGSREGQGTPQGAEAGAGSG